MQVNYNIKTIKCFFCNKDYDFHEINEDILFENALSCPKEHLIGYTWDYEWLLLTAPCQYHFIYHGEGWCRCVDCKVFCFGMDEECPNPLGRLCYEQGG